MSGIAYGKVSSKSQVVLPKPVRERLNVKQGDVLRFRVTEREITIEKVERAEDDPFATFSEWSSPEDDELFRDL
jgi:antitoxin PrlF